MGTKPPNILLVMFDQMSAQSLPCYGHAVVKAPHLQALADRGVVFEKAYCNSPLCSPCVVEGCATQPPPSMRLWYCLAQSVGAGHHEWITGTTSLTMSGAMGSECRTA